LTEIQATEGALALLSFEQHRNTGWDLRVCSTSGCPIQPVAIIGASVAANFGMAADAGMARFV